METKTIGLAARHRKNVQQARAIAIRTVIARTASCAAGTTVGRRTARRTRTLTVAESRLSQTNAMGTATHGPAAPHQGNAMLARVTAIEIPTANPASFVAKTTAEISTEMPNDGLIAANILERDVIFDVAMEKLCHSARLLISFGLIYEMHRISRCYKNYYLFL